MYLIKYIMKTQEIIFLIINYGFKSFNNSKNKK